MTPVSPVPTINPAVDARAALARLETAVTRVVHGKPQVVRLAVAALAARGHILIEDVPGVGKTTLARALARAVGGTFRRIQFTSDLLPSDILGVSLYNQETGRFEFRRGPIFANVVLADEINRTTPRTQSSLLEAMSEGRVSIDTQTHELDQPFIVIATQNPLEHFGTYPLPESQMDRFLLRLRMGYPSAADERRVVTEAALEDPVEAIEPVVDHADVAAIQATCSRVRVEEALLDYAQRVVAATRESQFLALGVSPRGFQGWYRAAKARALVAGRDYAVPDDFKETAIPALAHRLVLAGGSAGEPLGRAREEAERVMNDLLERVAVPS
ncbi:MAG: putative ATPase 3 [bacterium]|nr:putative ATPase 3 [bacterium]